MSARPVLIMAGGTGGHVYPALALARLLRRRSQPVVWLGTHKGLESRVVPAEQIPIEWLSVGGVRGKGWLTLCGAPFRLVLALWQALRVMRRHRPAAVVGLGGFVTGPGGVAAWLTRRPLIIHEQNAVAGFTNRCLSHLADEVLEAFPNSFSNAVRARTIGNPVREDIAAAATPQVRFSGRHGAINVLVFGGSQGAVRLNTVVPLALAALGAGLRLNVRHQAGARWQDAAVQNYAKSGVRAEVTAFIEDMAEAYGWADLVICRSGALTVCELAAVGVASILVPFPAAVDDHQTVNARYLVDQDAALLIADRDLTPQRLCEILQKLCADRVQLLEMAIRARDLAQPRAAQDLAQACLRYTESAA
ncbi:MAG TPA: undecaprenyldiphospho-muramoylpentapeptide beta-N-acetylglucosaminyltransferase [Steroidobacteraceae bacterium]|jgi:UDP-N-acetylglucosamine--N-acetylmuramyl-(pentapeptide) pyrophosphoryl-undecaprenol N-acetylglucosamine transferase